MLEFPGIHIEAVQPPVPAPVTHIDYSEEAMEYEKKLVQVTAALFQPVDWKVSFTCIFNVVLFVIYEYISFDVLRYKGYQLVSWLLLLLYS